MTLFQEKVYQLVSQIPKGNVSTYQLVAKALGIRSSQAVGQALKNNPFAPQVPCHRVVKTNGQIGGFSGSYKPSTVSKKINLLRSEGVIVSNGKIDLPRFLFEGFKI